MGWWAAGYYHEWLREAGAAGTPRDQLARDLRAAAGGRIPDDPERRAAALRLAEHQLQQWEETPRWLFVAFPAVLGLLWVNAVVSGGWWWPAALALTMVAVGGALQFRRLRRRVEELCGPLG